MSGSANSSIGAARKRRPPTFACSLTPLWEKNGGKAHLVSVVGGDVEIGAIAAAFANGDSFTVEDPHGAESIVSLGEKPLCFRGSIVVPGSETAAETSCELLAGTSGQHVGWEAASGQ